MDALKKKIGPLPLWGWLLAIVGGVLLAVVIKRALGAGEAAPAPEPVDPYADGDTAPTGSIGLPSGATTTTTGTEQPITDNGQWRARALSYLISRGADAALADRVLAKYLEGRQLTVDQNRLISLVLAGVGLPPDPPPLAPYPRPNPPDRGGNTPTPTPQRPATKAAAIAKCEAGDRWPNMYADWYALKISVNDPRLRSGGALTPCGAGYVAWLIANKGARPTPEDGAPLDRPTVPNQPPRPSVPAASGARTEPYQLPAAPAPNGTISVVPSSAPSPTPVPVLPQNTTEPLPVSVTPAPPSPTPTSSTTSPGGRGTRGR